ncbi:chromosome segregation protein SMC [Parashewanella spongiae]|uniref:Chromosome partition protein Smc n=1 Tax=Parashewanella spongiae TaxID=342950 RepID=A0A3A6UGV9_9GAMM|nr:chromosome segregation protein SMC [Parashewanella spongiae]MCL1077565.1 chromosome segregation protein SMC [Parashewanella spongiae]RJY18189.1 chromosome segregation protein SMC [Parashewanella spongiae]
MKLKQIKLAGFKSFVDPTKIPFQKALTGVIGPNGCGKSNVIDAVRWVLGESNAKHLRGGAMTDVIFSGSSARRPVSVAGVELFFDNQDGRLPGQYASYQEISVKRQVTRDGDSTYYLNGQKCRRKDITDLFMGTGLGPRSYAIIEQGMISRLIESKPQDLRVFIEEAAGISRYKERRRDTENRIRHTRENLERLGDIRGELALQLDKLSEQSKAALKYREHKKVERQTHAELLVLRYEDHVKKTEELSAKINQLDTELLKAQSENQTVTTKQTELNIGLSELVGIEQKKVAEFYQSGTQIAKLEQQISHQKEREEQSNQQVNEIKSKQSDLETQVEQQINQLNRLDEEVNHAQPEFELMDEKLGQLIDQIEQYEKTGRSQQDNFHAQKQKLSNVHSQQQVLATQIEHSASQILQVSDQINIYRQQLAVLEDESSVDSDDSKKLQELIAHIADDENRIQNNTKDLQSLEIDIHQSQQQQQQNQQAVAVDTSRLAFINSELLLSQSTTEKQLWQVINASPGWEKAVEVVLGHLLSSNVTLMELLSTEHNGFVESDGKTTHKLLSSSEVNLSPWLDGVHCAENLTEAKSLLPDLNQSHLIATKDGYLLGHGFLLGKAETSQSQLSLVSEQEHLTQQVKSLEVKQKQLNESLTQLLEQRTELNEKHKQLNSSLQESNLLRTSILSKQAAVREQKEKDEVQKKLLLEQLEYSTKQQVELELTRESHHEKQLQLYALSEQVQQELVSSETKVQTYRIEHQNLKQQSQQAQQSRNELQSKLQNLLTQQALVKQQVEQNNLRKIELAVQLQRISKESNANEAVGESIKDASIELQLQKLLSKQTDLQKELNEIRSQQLELQQQIDSLKSEQQKHVVQIQGLTQSISELKLQREGLKGQADSQLQLLKEEGIQLQTVMSQLDDNANISQWQQKLERVRSQIRQLGAINLAAISEFEQQSERKNYLDGQCDDLNQALQSLESAIRKIDKETRIRFKTTFEKVNEDLSQLFPKVFGGGSAYLALTDDDLLETGVTIMARPPGKKNSTIHLLSGGEKALTALSLVFAIFRLNPAPFCMLDEVDAPLDDANVERFCRLLKEMSKTVQFIYISHNKITMELAEQLIGVTMHEPGVSRIVTVDIDEAVALADAG